MENQHQKIKGYRDLSQAEIDLMNEIKAEGERLEALIEKVSEHLLSQDEKADGNSIERAKRRIATGPYRWNAIARTDLQTGLMALVRAVAQPESF